MTTDFHNILSHIYLMPKQAHFLNMRDRNAAYVGGFGSGKSRTLCAFVTIRTFGMIGEKGMLGAPTKPQLDASTLATLWEMWTELGIEEDVHYKYERGIGKVTCFATGSYFWIRSFSNSLRVQGPNLTWVAMDELEGVPDKVYRVLKTRVRAPLKDPRSFHAFRVVGNPPVGGHWFLRDYYRKQTKREGHEYITATSLENFFFDKETLHEMEFNIYAPGTPLWRRYIMGDLDAGAEGLVYSEFNEDQHCCALEDVPFKSSGRAHLSGIDFGWKNPFVWLDVLRTMHKGWSHYWIFNEYYQSERLMPEHAAHIKRHRMRVSPCYADHAAQERAELASHGVITLPAWKADTSMGIEAMKQLMNPMHDAGVRIHIVKDRCPNLMYEYGVYSWKEARDGKEIPEEVVKVDDHAQDASRYAITSDMKQRGLIITGKPVSTSKKVVDVANLGNIPVNTRGQRGSTERGGTADDRERSKKKRNNPRRKNQW